MLKNYFRLTRSETEIMELLWSENRPLSRSEIIDLTPNRTWKPASIHILLNSMLDKGSIEVAGFIQSTKNYARTFAPTLTADEYIVMQLKHMRKLFFGLFPAFWKTCRVRKS
ncbi:transcriptional regulator BlaI/MecI/CopY family [Clostridium sp. CAG:1013]|nr:transcriptional regulator BlaI/MecI/CopY family [Clostridium sp. CAG:1013]